MKHDFIVDKRKIIVDTKMADIKGINRDFKFILDTGATTSVIDKSVANFLKLNLHKAETQQLATIGGKINANVIKLPKINLLGKDFINFKVDIVDLPFQITLFADGLIGFDFLSKFSEIKIDFKKQIIEAL